MPSCLLAGRAKVEEGDIQGIEADSLVEEPLFLLVEVLLADARRAGIITADFRRDFLLDLISPAARTVVQHDRLVCVFMQVLRFRFLF
jgi:hypothetical protein